MLGIVFSIVTVVIAISIIITLIKESSVESPQLQLNR